MLKSTFALPTERSPSIASAVTDGDELHEEYLARAGLYRLLAGVFVEEPDARFVAALRTAEAFAAFTDAGLCFDADFTMPDEVALADALACEYATLFAASGGFPPVESVRLTGRYKQEPAFRTVEFYRAHGFVLGKRRFELFPDQLGVELMFVGELLERAAAAIVRGDAVDHHRLDKEIKRFWTQHLGRWVRGYCRLVERAASHSFYREMARFLAGFADEEIAAMALKRLDDLDQGRAEVPKQEVRVEFNPDEPVCNGCAPVRPDGGIRVSPLRPLADLRL